MPWQPVKPERRQPAAARRPRSGQLAHAGSPGRQTSVADGELTPAVPGPAAGRSGEERAARLNDARSRGAAARARARRLCQQSARVLAATAAVMEAIGSVPARGQSAQAWRDVLHRSEFARLLARTETMPVIEQAKGIIMAQSRCSPGEAFDILRRTSQRTNLPVRELAAQLVAQTSAPVPGGDGQTVAA